MVEERFIIMVERSTRYSSKHFYAVNFEPVRVETRQNIHGQFYHSILYAAVWFKKRQGLIVASEGTLSLSTKYSESDALPDFVEAFNEMDGRYGGQTEFQWDGERMFAPRQPMAAMQEAQVRLQGYLDMFPTPPPGYEGWFCIK